MSLGDLPLDPADPLALAAGALALLGLVLVLAQIATGRRLRALSADLARLAERQTAASGALEARISETAARMGEGVAGTAESLGALQERLAAIDRAQENIQRLSGDVLTLQDILANKQARGAFGEIQLRDLVAQILPPDAWEWQPTLSNGKRPDCLIRLPDPPGPIAVDAKFPLEPYEALVAAESERARAEAARAFRAAIRGHLRAIAEKYVAEGETGEGALMFVPAEAVYAELHARFPDLVREGFQLRVWIVSPTTCMATLTTLRAVLKDARMADRAGEMRTALRALHRDVELVQERAARLAAHFGQARGDLDALVTAAERAGRRAGRIDTLDFDDAPPPPRPPGPRILRHGEGR